MDKDKNFAILLATTFAIVVGSFITMTEQYAFNVIMMAAVVVSTWGTMLANADKKVNFAVNIISCVLICYVYLYVGLHAMAITYGFLFLMNVHKYTDQTEKKQENRKLGGKRAILVFCSFLAFGLLLAVILKPIFADWSILDTARLLFADSEILTSNRSVPLMVFDVVGAAGNVIGQILMNLRFLDANLYWIVVNVSQIAAFAILIFHDDRIYLWPMLIMYVIWLANSIMLIYQLKKSEQISES